MAGKGLDAGEGFTAQLESELHRLGYSVQVIDASVSGDTTSGGLARLDWVLAEPYSAAIVFLGYNDAFRAIPVELIRNNLNRIIETIQSRNLPVLLAGAKAPRNLGAQYYEQFDAVYPEIASQYDVEFFPFFLQDVATDPDLNQSDGIHPNKQGVSVIVRNMLPHVENLISRLKQ